MALHVRCYFFGYFFPFALFIYIRFALLFHSIHSIRRCVEHSKWHSCLGTARVSNPMHFYIYLIYVSTHKPSYKSCPPFAEHCIYCVCVFFLLIRVVSNLWLIILWQNNGTHLFCNSSMLFWKLSKLNSINHRIEWHSLAYTKLKRKWLQAKVEVSLKPTLILNREMKRWNCAAGDSMIN